MDPLDTLHAAHAHRIDVSQLSIAAPALPFWCAVAALLASGAALSVCAYSLISLSDLAEDLINPYTFSDRVNSRAKVEFAAHATAALALSVGLSPLTLFLAVPTLLVRCWWWHRKRLVVDATTCYHARAQSQFRIYWCIMLAWHATSLLFAFTQLTIHAVVHLNELNPSTLDARDAP